MVALAGLERFLDFCLSLNVCFGFSAGTEGFQDFCLSLNRRSDVRKMIGERAEFVCYANCVMDRTTLDAALDAAPGERWLMARPDVGGERIALSEQQFTDLITVHLADWLEQACADVCRLPRPCCLFKRCVPARDHRTALCMSCKRRILQG